MPSSKSLVILILVPLLGFALNVHSIWIKSKTVRQESSVGVGGSSLFGCLVKNAKAMGF